MSKKGSSSKDKDNNGSKRKKDSFGEDVGYMMYGFGDVSPELQDPQTVEIVDELLCEYVRYVASEASSVADGKRIGLDDLMFVLRKDKKKYDRIRELVATSKEIEKEKGAFKNIL